MDRRHAMKGLGTLALLPGIEHALGPLARADEGATPFARFDPIEASTEDRLVLPRGFGHDVVIRWGDAFTPAGETFGFNNDWIGYFPLKDEGDALLVVNHEYISVQYEGDAGVFLETFPLLRGRTPTLEDMKRDVGISIVRIRRDTRTGAWAFVAKDPLNRRVDAFTPCAVDGPAALALGGGPIEGTFDNCSGQVTPWGTALSCEENFQLRVPELVDAKGQSAVGGPFDLPGNHYGWVVEIDPYDPGAIPRKHTALGRFRHENVGLRAEAGRPVAAYMGDDRRGGHVWKFVSDELYRPGDRASTRRIFGSGRLYAARFNADGSGEWRLLDLSSPLDPNPDFLDPKPFLPPGARTLAHCYASQGAALCDAYQAANALGATPSGRPEDVEVHPVDGSVFVAFTAESGRPGLFENVFGEIWRVEEEGSDVAATRFRWSRFSLGGPADAGRRGRVYAQPDNMLFDARHDLWVATDISASRLNAREDYDVFANNGLFLVPVSGPERGLARQFASLPVESEGTGPAFAPREQALFLSIQHPGERHGIRTEVDQVLRGSNWPNGSLKAPPLPAVVAIRRS